MTEHPILVPFSGTVTVRWARYSDGRCHAKEFYDGERGCRAGVLALARQVAIKGIVGKQPENGHRLQGAFSDLYELKPGDWRFMGFRVGRDFYVTNGAPKASNQDPDYRFALKVRAAVLASLTKGKP